ncbi:OLC1v1015128C1 [Oldenlandia corymbosa var. corymbosa]|uniref:RING-type E3 ubiquitin transferase n=1 Tax=Oldenlandia corymbosa var. corymbosa TaxID=529605 RepID=A0AAV1E2L4_OLDCO|nr:OLC1v1015128C1 [Oldenlandia corymbosa var. corymbosa]
MNKGNTETVNRSRIRRKSISFVRSLNPSDINKITKPNLGSGENSRSSNSVVIHVSSRHCGIGGGVAASLVVDHGVLLGLRLALYAYKSFVRFSTHTSALRKIQQAPSVPVSDLRSLLSSSGHENSNAGKSVIVRGSVEAKSVLIGRISNWKRLFSRAAPAGLLIFHESGEKGVILHRTQSCKYDRWASALYYFFAGPESSIDRTVPFILVEPKRWRQPDYVIVDMEGSSHKLPLTTIHHHLQPVTNPPYAFLQALFGHEYPVGLLVEEKLLPLGKEITGFGICSMRDGTPVIKSCEDLPCFLSDLTKDQMVEHLEYITKVQFCSGIVVGSVAICILGYAAVRYWKKVKEYWNELKEWRHQWQSQVQNITSEDYSKLEEAADEHNGEVPDGQLCVKCLR